MRDELEVAASEKRASGFEESDLGEKRGPGGVRGDGGRGGRGGRAGKSTVLDRKQQRKLAKEREKAQRQLWSERKARVKARDGGGGGGAGDGKKSRDDANRGAVRRQRGEVDEREDAREAGKRAKKDASLELGASRPTTARKREDVASKRKRDVSSGAEPKKLAPKRIAPEQRMSRAALEAYKRDEAEQKRLLKRLKGRQKGPDDGLGGFFESLPGLELLADDDDARSADGAAERVRRTALGAASAAASRRPKVTLDSDEATTSDERTDPFAIDGEGSESESERSDPDGSESDARSSDASDDDGDDDDDASDHDDDDDGETPHGASAAPEGRGASGNAYVPPALRAAMVAKQTASGNAGTPSADARAAADAETAKRRVRGFMNRMGEANVFSVVSGVAELRAALPRRTLGDAATEEALKALTEGPRASSQYAAIIAAFVAGLAGALGPEVGARFGAALARRLDAARGVSGIGSGIDSGIGSGIDSGMDSGTGASDAPRASDASDASARAANPRAASNLCAVLARLFVCGLFPSAVVWGFLMDASLRLGELDAALTLETLRVAGPRLRAEDPVGMKRFIEATRERVAACLPGAANVAGAAEATTVSRRARLMLDMVVDLKNNKRTAGGDAGGAGGREGEDQWGFPLALSRVLKADAGVGDASVALRTLTHDKLRRASSGAPGAAKGQWWLPEAAGTEAWFAAREATRAAERGASATAAAAAARETGEGAALLRKAKAMRMNTESRRAVFCVVMGAEDFAEALDGLLRLPLAETQQREISRVLLECCLQETAYNPYYETLAAKLCERAPKKHRLALQLCVWDHVREIAPSVAEGRDDVFGRGGAEGSERARDNPKPSVRRVAHLARFVAGALVSGALAPSALKVVDFGGTEVDGAGSSAAARLFRRLLLQALLGVSKAKAPKSRAVFQTLAEKGLGRGGELGATRASLERALADEAFITEGLSHAKEDARKSDSAASVREAARQAGRVLRGELA